MRTVRFVSRVLVVLGVLGLFATAAHAGGGQGGGVDILNAFQCYLINADAPPPTNSVVNLVDQFGTRQNVRIGAARLICTPVQGMKPVPEPADPNFNPLFDPLPDGADHIKCYQISPFERDGNGRFSLYNPDAVVDLTDELDVVTNVQVSVPAFICTLAKKDCRSGSDCPAPVE